MLKKCRKLVSYQRGGWSPGSKHQKHMTLNPTTYMYRFPGPHGPGPYTMKYWWTLGQFPTGLSVPFRLNEFLATYQREHVPIEVEEWLGCFLRDPVSALEDAVNALSECLEESGKRETPRGYEVSETMIKPALEPLKKMEEQLGIRIPPVAVRAAMGKLALRERLLDDLYDYKSALADCGSTPHRRLGRSTMEQPQLEVLSDTQTTTHVKCKELPPALGIAVGQFASPPKETADDETKLIRLLTTFAEGCAAKDKYDDAYSILSSSLLFAHDEVTQSAVHANASIASLLDGHFNDAAYHGREAALLIAEPLRSPKVAARGYQLWATAVAYDDDIESAESIVNDALMVLPNDDDLTATKEKICQLKADQHRSLRSHIARNRMLKSQQTRGILNGSGSNFDNEFDWVVFKNKLYPSKLNPSTNEMGSVFRRVGDLGGFVSTSRSSELL